MSKHTPALTPIQRIKRLREHYPSMRLTQAKQIVDEGEDAAMIAEIEAEIRVRAAAPDLLEALENLVAQRERDHRPGTVGWSVFVEDDPLMETARVAIAKARGAS